MKCTKTFGQPNTPDQKWCGIFLPHLRLGFPKVSRAVGEAVRFLACLYITPTAFNRSSDNKEPYYISAFGLVLSLPEILDENGTPGLSNGLLIYTCGNGRQLKCGLEDHRNEPLLREDRNLE